MPSYPVILKIRPQRDDASTSVDSVLAEWAGKKPQGEQTCIIREGRRKIHQAWLDGSETVEEFDVITDRLLIRKHRKPTTLGGEGKWIYEVGAETKVFNPDIDLFAPSAQQPVRVRNCPWPESVYSVVVDNGCTPSTIVIRTTNKKFFKRFPIPDLLRAGITKLDSQAISFVHEHGTLIVRYKKPAEVLKLEEQCAQQRKAMKSERIKDNVKGPDCPQQ